MATGEEYTTFVGDVFPCPNGIHCTNNGVNMSEPNNTDDTFYLSYKDGFSWLLASLAIILYIPNFFGIVCNVLLIYVTARNKSLKYSYNYLLAYAAVGDILHEISYNVTLYFTITGVNFIDLLPCFYAQSYGVLGVAISFTSMFLLAFDRLISIICPMWHRKVNTPLYMFVLCLTSSLFSAYLLYVCFDFALRNPNQKVICMYSACFLNEAGRVFFRSCIAFNGSTVLCYTVIWILMWKIANGNEIKETRRIFKSLFLIMLVVVFGWMVNGLLELVLPYVTQNGKLMWFLTRIGAFGISVASAINLPILYFFSSEYRQAFTMELYRGCSKFTFTRSWVSTISRAEVSGRRRQVTVTQAQTIRMQRF